MVDATGNILTPVLQKQLIAVKRTTRAMDIVQLQLATGKLVNSALDNPQSFFNAKSLSDRAADLTRLLDGIGQSTRTIQEALIGTKALERLIDQAEAVTLETQQELRSGVLYPDLNFVEEELTNVTGPPLSQLIQADNPNGYWRLNEGAGVVATNSGSGAGINGTYVNGVTLGDPALYSNSGGTSATFNGGNQRVNIPDSNLINLSTYTARTVELVFNANDIVSRQVLYEEGAAVNGFTIYVDNGLIRVSGEDDDGGGRWFDADISAPIVAGQTYHIAFVFDQPNNSFTGYLDGVDIGSVTVANSTFPSHSGNIAIGGMNDGAQFHDGESSAANGFYFNGSISDVALYNRALLSTEIFEHADSLDIDTATNYINTEFDSIIEQIDSIVQDAQYRGINLLSNDNLTTYFNEERSSSLTTEGTDFSASGLGIGRFDFNDSNDIDDILADLREARGRVRSFGRTLVSDLSVIETRNTFTRNTINHLKSGGDDLTIADQNELGAELLALSVRQDLQTVSLSFSTGLSIASFL